MKTRKEMEEILDLTKKGRGNDQLVFFKKILMDSLCNHEIITPCVIT